MSPGGVETCSKTPIQENTELGTQIYISLQQRILKSCQAVYFRKANDPGAIPHNTLLKAMAHEIMPSNMCSCDEDSAIIPNIEVMIIE